MNGLLFRFAGAQSNCGVILPVPPLLLNVTVFPVGIHCAYNVVLVVIVKVFPLVYEVPEPSAAVFHPLKVWHELLNVPVLPKTVTVSPEVYGLFVSLGTDPPVLPFPS